MSEKGYRSLKGIVESFGSDIIDFIVYAKDKNVQQDYTNEIINFAVENNIRVYEKSDIYAITSKYIIAISWRWLIPINTENTLITLHDSLLPKYRGFSPLVNQLLNREPYIGVTAIVSNTEYDKGDIIAQSKTKVNYPIRIKDAIAEVSELYVDVLKIVIRQAIENKSLKTTTQNESEATYSLWRDEEDYRIDWNQSSKEIRNFIFALGFPYKGASAYILNKKIRIHDAIELNDLVVVNRNVGKVIFMENNFPVVVCGKGLLKITDATYDVDGKSIFPLNKFRIRFL
jgi:methionyl-tRNA formyltransferase